MGMCIINSIIRGMHFSCVHLALLVGTKFYILNRFPAVAMHCEPAHCRRCAVANHRPYYIITVQWVVNSLLLPDDNNHRKPEKCY